MKKGFFSLFLLVFFGCAVFYFGLVGLKLPAGCQAVMLTKTNGVDKNIIKGHGITWRWQALLPTNVTLVKLPEKSVMFNKSVSGFLPSANVYASFIKGECDFEYNVSFDITLSLKDDGIINAVEQRFIYDSSEFDQILDDYAEKVCNTAALYIIENSSGTVLPVLELSKNKTIVPYLQKALPSDLINIDDISIKQIKLPDVELYNTAKKSFNEFQILVDEELAKQASVQAARILEDNRGVNRISKLGQALQQYPELTDILKNSDTAAIIKTFNFE